VSAADDEVSFTIDDIKRLASEVGIEPRHIAKAAEQLGEPPKRLKRFEFFGAHATEVLERTYDGLLDDEAWEDLVGELRLTFGSEGTSTQVGHSQEWKGGTDTISAHLSATVRNGRTRYRLAVNRTGGISITWALGFPVMFLTWFILNIALSRAQSGLFEHCLYSAIALGITYGLTHAIAARWANASRPEIESLMDRISELTPHTAALQPSRADSVRQSTAETLTENA
jgi:hypothetical protein